MKMFTKLMAFPAFLLSYLVLAVPLCFGGELIAPTRTLGGTVEVPGKLIVVSEPPGLEVFLDEDYIGETPLLVKEVKPGLHKLRVKQAETDIYVEPNKTRQISLFKGSFVDIPEKKEEPLKPEPKKQQPTQARRTVVYPSEERQKDLSSWDLFVNGSQPFF